MVCLSFGERGESAKLWRKGNMTEEAVKQVRREEAQAAAAIPAPASNSLISVTIRCAPIKRRYFVWRMCIAVSSPTLS